MPVLCRAVSLCWLVILGDSRGQGQEETWKKHQTWNDLETMAMRWQKDGISNKLNANNDIPQGPTLWPTANTGHHMNSAQTEKPKLLFWRGKSYFKTNSTSVRVNWAPCGSYSPKTVPFDKETWRNNSLRWNTGGASGLYVTPASHSLKRNMSTLKLWECPGINQLPVEATCLGYVIWIYYLDILYIYIFITIIYIYIIHMYIIYIYIIWIYLGSVFIPFLTIYSIPFHHAITPS